MCRLINPLIRRLIRRLTDGGPFTDWLFKSVVDMSTDSGIVRLLPLGFTDWPIDWPIRRFDDSRALLFMGWRVGAWGKR